MKQKTIEHIAALCMKYKIRFSYGADSLYINDSRMDPMTAYYRAGELKVTRVGDERSYTYDEMKQNLKAVHDYSTH